MAIIERDLLETVKKISEKDAFLFDMDGLIFDTERMFMEQHAVVMKEHGYHLTRDIYVETLGLGGEKLKTLMKSYYGNEYPFAAISSETVRRVGIVAETVGLTVKPQISETLAYLKKKGIPCAVASSTRSDMVRIYLEKANLLTYFNEIIGGEMVTHSKPEPDIFLLACEKLGKTPQQCVVLEDSENGVKAAINAGCEVICIPDLKEPSPEVINAAAYVIQR